VAELSTNRMSWREWSSEPPPVVYPTGTGQVARMINAHAGLGQSPVAQIGGVRLPVLGRARVYVCGITPYDTTHVGHAATFVWADVAARVLRLTGAEVDVCRNVTDVDDHLLVRAQAEGVPWRSLAIQETYRFERDMAELGVVRPTYEPRSHDFVAEVIALAAALVDQGAAYERNGSVYFHAAQVPERAGLNREQAIVAGSRAWRTPRRPRQGRPSRCRCMATLHRGRAGLVESLGPRAPGLACRVHRDGSGNVRTGG
jgi:hypothetical protein